MSTQESRTLPHCVTLFLDHLWLEFGLEKNTCDAYFSDLKQYHSWLSQQTCDLLSAESTHIMAYLGYLSEIDPHKKSTTGQPLPRVEKSTQSRTVCTLRRFYAWLQREHLRTHNPMDHIAFPKHHKPIPRVISEEDVERLITAPNVHQPKGLRDRTMLEVMYATGIRVSELIFIQKKNISLESGTLQLVGKGQKERLLPVGQEAMQWIKRYIQEALPHFDHPTHPSPYLFLSQQKRPMTRQSFWHIVKNYAQQVIPHKHLSPHTLRHAFATHLIHHGADLRIVQLLLGHEDISSTQIYTHIAQSHLVEMHNKHHPRA